VKNLFLALTFVVLANLAFAQSSSTMERANIPQALTFGKHTLVANYISNGVSGSTTTVSSGQVPLDNVRSISCPGTTGTCVFQIDAWVQVGGSSFAGSDFAVCLVVDGALVNNTCFFSGEIPADGSFNQMSSSITTGAVKSGAHNVQTQIFTNSGAEIGFFTINYKVFKP